MPPKKRTYSFFIFHFLLFISFTSCSIEKQISKSANEVVLTNKALTAAHVGISIYEPAANKYWFNHQGDKYFVPASNTKIPTCYAAMKYLGDSLVGARISVTEKNILLVFPSGDPSFLNAEFLYQPVFEAMKPFKEIYLYEDQWKNNRWGSGWS